MNGSDKQRAPRNRTLTLSTQEEATLSKRLLRSPLPAKAGRLADQIVCGNFIELLPQLPRAFVDLLILDPPYNLTKRFGAESFRERSLAEYEEWFEGWFVRVLPLLKPTASLYVCGEWKSSGSRCPQIEKSSDGGRIPPASADSLLSSGVFAAGHRPIPPCGLNNERRSFARISRIARVRHATKSRTDAQS